MMNNKDSQYYKNLWRMQSWTVPDIPGGKKNYYFIVSSLIKIIETNHSIDPSMCPSIEGIDTRPWREYLPYLNSMGLVVNKAGDYYLTEVGEAFNENMIKSVLASIMQKRIRLFGEILEIIEAEPDTVQGVNSLICAKYGLNWSEVNNTRRRMDWLEALDLIEAIGARKWKLTEAGKTALSTWDIISPDIVIAFDSIETSVSVSPAPEEISSLLNSLRDDESLQKERSAYNIWVPSPNRIENLRSIVSFSKDRVEKRELFDFICKEYNLKTSSVESMLPFLRVSGLVEEVGRNVYQSTPAAKAWNETNEAIDFIRILHSKMRFVGEIIDFASNDTTRNVLYQEGKKYGMNVEKTRWIVGFLLEAGLVEEPRYLHIKSTSLGVELVKELPLANPNIYQESPEAMLKEINEQSIKGSNSELIHKNDQSLFEYLKKSALDPVAENKASGVAFEERIAEVFRYMGFNAKRIGGSGDTDVVVHWRKSNGDIATAIVDGKSKTSGLVSHSDVSDVALDTHKEKNNAEYVAIVGADFSGNTIKNHAAKKGIALIKVEDLQKVACSAKKLGLTLEEVSLMFKADGLSEVYEIIEAKARESQVITIVVSTLKREQEALGSLSARDLYLLLRNTDLSPSLDELVEILDLLSQKEIQVVSIVNKSPDKENITYELRPVKPIANRLRMLADSVEAGIR